MEFLHNFTSAPADFLVGYAVPFILIISVLVFVHEWGHYIVARMCGVRVDAFSIGFGREIFGFNDKNGTRWKFCMVPLGGYVQMFGDTDPASTGVDKDVAEKDKKDAFFAQPLGKKSAIVAAGPAINFLFAIIVFMGLFYFNGQPYTPPVASAVVEGSPAEIGGILPDDRILSINGKKIHKFQDISQEVSVNLGREMTVEVLRATGPGAWGGDPLLLKIKPEVRVIEDRFGFIHSRGLLGIQSPVSLQEVKEHNALSALGAATVETWRISLNTLKAIGQIITGTRSTDELGGIIRIGAYAGEFAQAGVIAILTFSALLSVNLGLLNLLPIPMLDGGHLAFYAMEKLKGGPLSERLQEYALRLGFFFLIGVMVFATWNDLAQLKVFDYLSKMLS